MFRHLTLTIASSPAGVDLIAQLEHEFRPFDYKSLEPMNRETFICRWNKVRPDNAFLLMKSYFGTSEVGSMTLARLENPNDAPRSVPEQCGVTQTVGISVVRAKRLARFDDQPVD